MSDYDLESPRSPLRNIDTSFNNYVRRKQQEESGHMEGGVPDYAFALDCELRKKLMQIPGLFTLGKKVLATYATREMHLMNQDGLAVGPDQYPELYQMGVDCARRLGIGVPNMYVIDRTSMNAYTIAADDISPVIVLHSGLIERMTPGEVKCVIAHECGHIHNNHAVLKYLVGNVLSAAGTSTLAGLALTAANIALITFWTRAGEVTADRAALICADDVNDALWVNYKFMYGAALNNAPAMNLDALHRQLEEILASPTRIMEIGDMGSLSFNDHPGSIRRIFTEMEFTECETFYRWRPELKKPGTIVRSKAETDGRCQKLVNILNNR